MDDSVVEGFFHEFCLDGTREDIGTSKCLHCLFRRKCRHAPNGCTFIDDRTPLWRISFMVWSTSSWRDNCIMTYDCGFLMKPDQEPVIRMPDELDLELTHSISVYPNDPFSSGRSPLRILPMRGETMEDFNIRARREVAEIEALLTEYTVTGSVKTKVRMILEKTGHGDELAEMYGDDVEFMAADYWPGMSLDEIVDMYGRKRVEVTPEVYREHIAEIRGKKRKKEAVHG